MRAKAMRQGSTLSYLFADQLVSTSVVANSSGSKTAEVRYKAWGEDRYTSGTAPTSYRYTGQRVETTIGLYYYGARWYDAALGRFVQVDTVVASMGDPQAWDRYAYVENNPVKFVDPTGHMLDQGGGASSMGDDWWKNRQTTTKKTQTHNDPLLDPEYSNWRNLVRGSPCTACHVTHNTGRVPTNDELDPDLVDYYRSLDELALTIHLAALGAVAAQAGFSSEIDANTPVNDISNKLNHIFGNPEHNLDDLVEVYGGQQGAYDAVQEQFSKIAGNYSVDDLKVGVQVNVAGFNVTVRGTIVNGEARIGTFFIPK